MKLSGAVVAFVLSAAANVAPGSADSSTVAAASKVAAGASAIDAEKDQQQQQQQPFEKPSKYGHGVKPGPREKHSVRAAAAEAYKKVPKLRAKSRDNRKAFDNTLRSLARPKESLTRPAPLPQTSRRHLSKPTQQSSDRKLNENYNQAYNEYNNNGNNAQYGQQQYNYGNGQGGQNGQQQYNGNGQGQQYNGNNGQQQYNGNNAQNGNGQNQQQQNQNGQNGNGQNGQQNAYYNYNGNGNNANQDEYYSYGGEYDWDQAMYEQDFGFDITDYAIKYTGCHRIESYNDNIAQNELINSVLGKQSFATFRLCPEEECFENNQWGCSQNYGEYVVSMEDFLDGLFSYNEERVYGYCEYCSECANIESYKDWAKQVVLQKQYTIENAETLFETYYESLVEKEQEEMQYNGANNNNGNNNNWWWNWGGNGNANANGQGDEEQYNQNQYLADMDEDEAKAYAMVKYYNKVKDNQYSYGANAAYGYGNNNNNGGNANQNQYSGGYYANGQYNPANGYYGGNNQAYMQQNMAMQYDAYNQNWWNFEDGNQANNNGSYQKKQQYQAWQSMGQFATYGPYMVYPGYFDDDGEFVSQYGYFNSNGNYMSLEDEDEIEYDEQIYGEMPDGWGDLVGMDPDEVESCEMNYASNCYTQYTTCMYLLYDEGQDEEDQYNAYMQQQYAQYFYGNGDNGDYDDVWEMMEANWESYKEQMEEQQVVQNSQRSTHNREKEIEQLMMCQQVNYNPYKWPGYGNYQQNEGDDTYNNQKSNAEMYQYNMYIESQIEACGGDADCEEALEYQREQNAEYQQWLKDNQSDQWKEYQNENLFYYVGAACDSGSGGIGMAVYRDQECQVIDEDVSVEKILGYDPMDFIDELIPQECINCRLDEQQTYMQQQQWYENEEQNDDYDAGVAPICSLLYQVSGKCNQNLVPKEQYEEMANGYYSDGQYYETQYATWYQSSAQQANEELVCSFIESLNSGTYNSDGQIYLNGASTFSWQHPGVFATQGEPQEIPGAMKAALTISALAATGMAILACMLHGALARKNIPWRPKRIDGEDPTDIARQNSGIVMGRSRSGPATAPLI